MNKAKLFALVAAAASAAMPANAAISSIMNPMMVAGDPSDIYGPGTGDTPGARVDPNVPTSPYSGVVSINIRFSQSANDSFICSGTLIDATHILTAAHCVDATGTGGAIDVSQSYDESGRDVRIKFNATATGDGASLITAKSVTIHPDFNGFGQCPGNSGFGCYNDDMAIIELSSPAPIDAQIYAIARDQVNGGVFEMVGYGESGDGVGGYSIGPSSTIKRFGANEFDVFLRDDEFGVDKEVWLADFDGADDFGSIDLYCYIYGVCAEGLGNQIETIIGAGDSGGPSFIRDANGKLYLAATNTFAAGNSVFPIPGGFGNEMGGMLLYSYLDWIFANSDAEGIPEPAMLGLFGLGAIGLGLSRRRRKTA